MKISEAVQSNPEGVLINLRVTPGASKSGFGGYDKWRRCIRVSVVGQPRKGEANKEIISMISDWFDLEESNIEIKSGLRDRSKTVLVKGIDVEGALAVLEKMEEK